VLFTLGTCSLGYFLYYGTQNLPRAIGYLTCSFNLLCLCILRSVWIETTLIANTVLDLLIQNIICATFLRISICFGIDSLPNLPTRVGSTDNLNSRPNKRTKRTTTP